MENERYWMACGLDMMDQVRQRDRERLREATYDLADGRSVYYDDGKETLRDAADLYAVLSELHGTGSPNLENLQARHILDRLQTGQGLAETHIGTLRGLLAKHKDKINELRQSQDRDGQDVLAIASGGSDSRIIPATTKESKRMTDDQLDNALRRLREARHATTPAARRDAVRGALVTLREEEPGLLEAMGIDRAELDGLAATVGLDVDERDGLPLRESVLFREKTLVEAVTMDADATRQHNRNVPLLEAMGIDRDLL